LYAPAASAVTDRVELDADAGGCVLPDLFGAVGYHADSDALAEASEDLRRLRPRAQLFFHPTKQIRGSRR
jgi:hypothetical protein